MQEGHAPYEEQTKKGQLKDPVVDLGFWEKIQGSIRQKQKETKEQGNEDMYH